jgi:carotenoid cleavage dioxygenase
VQLGDYVGITGLLVMALGRLQKLLGVADTSSGGGTANTAMVAHARRLLALHEGDLPYAVGGVVWGHSPLGRVSQYSPL